MTEKWHWMWLPQRTHPSCGAPSAHIIFISILSQGKTTTRPGLHQLQGLLKIENLAPQKILSQVAVIHQTPLFSPNYPAGAPRGHKRDRPRVSARPDSSSRNHEDLQKRTSRVRKFTNTKINLKI
ncbi:uncharacterized protein LOC123037290 [Drosophila rhopaloa]|uniref:Uncharacterized protein n=1 Tax=Drosophila rhopaloa TaxID=1041015 RepID=A0ABM5J391_DRORH|nr:uncharacterized protein LOC123037290 [Drosophila rhopaloa]